MHLQSEGDMCKLRFFLVVALLVGLLVGCSMVSRNSDLVLENDTENEMEIMQASPNVQKETLESSQVTKIVVQVKPYQTSESTREITYIAYPTQTITLTREPTISVEEFEEFRRNLYRTNGGCELPCLWGFTPGGNLDDVIDDFFEYNLIRNYTRADLPDRFHIMFFVPDDINPYDVFEWNIEVNTSDGIIQNVGLNASYLQMYNEQGLEWLLKDLGNPEDYDLRVFFLDRPTSMYEIHVYYPEKGMRVSWREEVESIEFDGDTFQAKICPKNYADNYESLNFATHYSLPNIYTWIPGNNPFPQLENPLTDENSDADLEHFYETYFDTEKTVCFTYYGVRE